MEQLELSYTVVFDHYISLRNSMWCITQAAAIHYKQGSGKALGHTAPLPKARSKCLGAVDWMPVVCCGTHIDKKNFTEGFLEEESWWF